MSTTLLCVFLLSTDELLYYTKWFFSLPTQVRMSLARNAWNPKNSNRYHGYYPVVADTVCHKEGMSYGEELPSDDPDLLSPHTLYDPNLWPPQKLSGAVEFKQFAMTYYRSMSELGLELTRLLASGIGKNDDYFDDLFVHKPLNSLRFMHYPLRQGSIPEAAKKDGLVLTCLEHADTPFLTVLSTFYNEGLQIQKNDGLWSDVEVRPDCLVMNAGDALVKATGRFKATRHRVIDHGEERYSVPFFLEPNFYSEIGRYAKESPPQSEEAIAKCNEDEPMQYGPWVLKRMREKNYTDFSPKTLHVN